MIGPSLVLSQALGLWDAQLITLSFKSFTSHSAAVIELRCGSRTNTTLTGSTAMSIHTQNCKYSKQVLLDYILRHDFRPHKLLFIPHNTILWCYKQSVQPAARKNSTTTHFPNMDTVLSILIMKMWGVFIHNTRHWRKFLAEMLGLHSQTNEKAYYAMIFWCLLTFSVIWLTERKQLAWQMFQNRQTVRSWNAVTVFADRLILHYPL